MKTLPVLVFLLAAHSLAAEMPDFKTLGLDNGRFWNTLNPVMRQAYVAGIYEGWQLRGFTEDIVAARVLRLFTADERFASADVADLVSSIYTDAENASLPVGWVVLASVVIERGDNDRHTVLVALRKQMSELMKARKPRPGTDLIPINVILGTGKK